MNAIVLFSSKGGNTERIAREVASELKCEYVKIGEANVNPDLNNIDLIFIGTGVYWGNPNADMERYIQEIGLQSPKHFAIFMTWGGAGKTNEAVFTKLKGLLKAKGHLLFGDTFECFGGRKFALARRGHPNSEDTQAARQWARKIADSLKSEQTIA